MDRRQAHISAGMCCEIGCISSTSSIGMGPDNLWCTQLKTEQARADRTRDAAWAELNRCVEEVARLSHQASVWAQCTRDVIPRSDILTTVSPALHPANVMLATGTQPCPSHDMMVFPTACRCKCRLLPTS